MAEISVTETDQRQGTARILDVREDFEVAEGDKTLVFSQPGALNATGLEEVIQEVKNLDMAQVQTQTAQQQN